ncbi:MAG: SH3 domain-containing protein [Anaerolineae bacterium]|nr:SH3 domain-containing protein [Anaerolineae bacterium]
MGTGAAGLNLRDEPRLSGDVQFRAQEGDRLKVLDGPQFFDDLEWCEVESLTRPGQFGWAARDFLIAADALNGE